MGDKRYGNGEGKRYVDDGGGPNKVITDKKNGWFAAAIHHEGSMHNLGSFPTMSDANKAAETWIKENANREREKPWERGYRG